MKRWYRRYQLTGDFQADSFVLSLGSTEREAGSQVRVEFERALALRSEIRRAAWFN
jgi:hypothetical protein